MHDIVNITHALVVVGGCVWLWGWCCSGGRARGGGAGAGARVVARACHHEDALVPSHCCTRGGSAAGNSVARSSLRLLIVTGLCGR